MPHELSEPERLSLLYRISIAGTRAVNREHGVRSRVWWQSWACWARRIQLVAHSESEYVTIAESLARDLPRLAELRSTLRHRMQTSVLMDTPRFARNIEAAYRSMWRAWCASQSPIRKE